MSFKANVASRVKKKLRILLSASSGSGKTYGSLLIAKGICNDWSKVYLIDTENESGNLYADLGNYKVVPFEQPYTPERYIEAIRYCESEGAEVIIIDSITHEWSGQGKQHLPLHF